jgi:hypothetical protein
VGGDGEQLGGDQPGVVTEDADGNRLDFANADSNWTAAVTAEALRRPISAPASS